MLVIVSMCPGDLTSASILAAITRPAEQICMFPLPKRVPWDQLIYSAILDFFRKKFFMTKLNAPDVPFMHSIALS